MIESRSRLGARDGVRAQVAGTSQRSKRRVHVSGNARPRRSLFAQARAARRRSAVPRTVILLGLTSLFTDISSEMVRSPSCRST